MIPMNEFNPDAATIRDVQHAAMLYRLLAQYCEQKSLAMAHRASGNIIWALEAERHGDKLYKSLPDGWRW